ncbi:MAG TPA: SDR family NAD(P)-dependent oxidoreductase [Pseudonocardiaceae bacterium]
MSTAARENELVIGFCPLGEQNPRLVAAVSSAGGLGVLDLGTGDRRARQALANALRWATGPIGVRLSEECALTPDALRDVHTIVLVGESRWRPADFAAQLVLTEVVSLAEALRAVEAGVDGLIVRGSESGGRIGELGTFVLLQQVLADARITVPVWAAGGIGERTAVAAVVAGAAGVVLDIQLALLAESELPGATTNVLRGMDGSESTVVDGARMVRSRTADTLLPIGQDGFLAEVFAKRWHDVGGAVRALRAAMLDGGQAAIAALRPDAPMREVLGTASPVVQGPMTRVSDEPEFAATVADHGALPMIALALSTADQTRDVLLRTRDAVGGKPWGVGILGFAPEETRAAQLDVIKEIRPTHAIIAGGRPAQAAALEEAGIATFLHVPSPGLLGQFLRGGARKFVFEGAECGGHVGPRNSFPLWEAQIGVLTEFADADGLAVLFAGGIHDARSAAMVLALAAPLIERGVAVGLLMGTAYLFTEEAVRAGAITSLFQRQVCDSSGTALLQTAPGHATRAAISPFTTSFADRERTLRAEGVGDRERWEQLEQLNVGRLRVASKGITRDGANLVPVDESAQLADGLFMAGDVTVLRSATTTIDALHKSVTDEAAAFLGETEPEIQREGPAPVDIAIVGMSAMMPGAPDVDTFWSNVVRGIDSVTEVPAERWDAATYYSETGEKGRTPSKWGGFLPEIPFDPLRYGIPPAALGSIEPVQLLALEAAHRALVDASLAGPKVDRSRISVFFGAEAGSDLSNASVLRTTLPAYLGTVPTALAEQLPELTEDSFPGMLANVIAGRIANRLDLGGANYTVDAACASSLAAVDIACKELVSGNSDVVLCGGADLHNGINDYLLFSSVHALSPTGRSRTFDAAADGIALGEGVACVVLKRLADAERDGDRIYAVVKGVGGASDGRSLGLTAPRPEGQRSALERAYRNAGVSPNAVGLVEAHGTGTVVGDRTELATLTDVFTEAGAEPGSCVLGSVKSQIGHTKCAAGLAGLIKAALAIHTGVRPATAHLADPNPVWAAETSPFSFHTEARPWPVPNSARVAGVSAFGFGGTNFHVVLQGHDAPPPAHGLPEWPAELFLFRGADFEAARRQVRTLLDTIGDHRLRDLALLAATRADADPAPVRIAFVATDLDDLAKRLRAALDEEQPATEPGKIAFLFPGQGSQRPGMLAELFTAFPELHHYLDPRWAAALHPPAAFDDPSRADQRARITDTQVAQPVLGIAGLAVADLLGRAGVRPDLVAGHSYGELVALCAAGAIEPDALPDLSARRAAAILAATGADPGSMAAVAAGGDKVERALHDHGLADEIVIANFNAPEQTVISGPTEAIGQAVDRFKDAGMGAKRLPVACAFHSPLVAGSGERFAEALAATPIREPEIPVYANSTARRYDSDDIRAALAAQLTAPVRFVEQIEAMYAAGARVFVESGPGTVLTTLVGKILGDRPHHAIAAQPGRDGDLRGLLTALAKLALAGVDVRAEWLVRGRGSAVQVKRPGWTVNGQLVRTAAGDIPAGALTPARRVEQEAVVIPSQPTDQDALITEFLRTGREMVAAQRDVLLAYLGSTPAPIPSPVVASPAVAPIPVTTVVAAPEPVVETGPVDLLSMVVGVIADRTGYPVDMIEPDLDLEADLSIDSIKRAEIAGELAIRLGLDGSLGDEQVEELAKARTIAAITGWLGDHQDADTQPAQHEPAQTQTAQADTAQADAALEQLAQGHPAQADLALEQLAQGHPSQADPAQDELSHRPAAPAQTAPRQGALGRDQRVEDRPVPVIEAPRRLIMRPVPLPVDVDRDAIRGKRFLVIGGGDAVRAQLAERGALVVDEGPFDGVLDLSPLTDADDDPLTSAFPRYQELLRGGLNWLVAVAPIGRGVGLRGFFRTVVREYPYMVARIVNVDDVDDIDGQINMLINIVDELGSADAAPVVLHTAGGRFGLEPVETPLPGLAASGAGPAGIGTAEAEVLGLDRDSVALLVGGGRGITARFAGLLAEAARPHVHLAGRTALPEGPEDSATAGVTDPVALRGAVIATGLRNPAEVERAVGTILAQREVAATLAEIRALGATAEYHCVDARDADAMAGLVKEIHAEHGRLDLVVHAAGVIADKLIADKDPAAFERVYDTKVGGARALLNAVGDLPSVPTAVLFGSIAGALGNRGQADYAAANDALETIGAEWALRTGARALTVHWGPWAAGGNHDGMVTEELMREYARRGITLIDPEEGMLALLRELAWGTDNAVLYTASGW